MKRFFLVFFCIILASFPIRAQKLVDVLNRFYSKPEKIYQHFIHSEGDSIWSVSDAVFQGAVTAEQLSGLFKTIEMQLGEYQGEEKWELSAKSDDAQTYTRMVLFKNFKAPIHLSFNADNKLIGLFLGNPEAVKNASALDGEQDIVVSTDGMKLPGKLVLPKNGTAPYPCVVLVHGSGPSDMNEQIGQNRPFYDIAKGLSERGIAVIRYDKRTYVYKNKIAPDGKQVNYDTEVVDDAVAAVRLAGTFREIDKKRIYIVGHSLGANLAPRIAERANNVAGLVMMAGTSITLKEVIQKQIRDLMKGEPQEKIDETIKSMIDSQPASYWEMDADYSVGKTLKNLKQPVLILQGERDYQVTMEMYRMWDKYAKGKNISCKSYPKLNHLFIEGEGVSTPQEYAVPGNVAQYVLDDIAKFILKR
ncbi:alpha/beta fold hydrolase [Prevotella sp. HUN102]|uniref:alpha/beta hydrolase n=1 Tax=Prevotella sp. HUN102 TaxID=1392486 RepID=UPI000567864E|nr:alpha/beta fold hydrolase [Prevotella sp. HUN102]